MLKLLSAALVAACFVTPAMAKSDCALGSVADLTAQAPAVNMAIVSRAAVKGVFFDHLIVTADPTGIKLWLEAKGCLVGSPVPAGIFYMQPKVGQ